MTRDLLEYYSSSFYPKLNHKRDFVCKTTKTFLYLTLNRFRFAISFVVLLLLVKLSLIDFTRLLDLFVPLSSIEVSFSRL